MDFRGFDSIIIFILRGGIPRPIVNFPESLTQAMLVGVMLVGGLGVNRLAPSPSPHLPASPKTRRQGLASLRRAAQMTSKPLLSYLKTSLRTNLFVGSPFSDRLGQLSLSLYLHI